MIFGNGTPLPVDDFLLKIPICKIFPIDVLGRSHPDIALSRSQRQLQWLRIHIFHNIEHRFSTSVCDSALDIFSDFPIPIGSMVLYLVTWIPSIYPLYVSIFLPAPWIRHGIDLPIPILPAWGGGGPGPGGEDSCRGAPGWRSRPSRRHRLPGRCSPSVLGWLFYIFGKHVMLYFSYIIYLYFIYILYIYIVIQWEINGIYPLVMSK